MRILIALSAFIFMSSLSPLSTAQVTSAFVYQGKLERQGSAANGVYDFQFLLFNSETGVSAIANPESVDDVSVIDGVFQAEINFGAAPWGGGNRWLEVRVREGDSTGGYTILSPRHQVTPVPLAQHALNVASDAIGAAQLSANSVGSSELSTASVNSSELADGAVDERHLALPWDIEQASFGYLITLQNTGSGGALRVVSESSTSSALRASGWQGTPAFVGDSYNLSSNDDLMLLQNNSWVSYGSSWVPNTVFRVKADGDVRIDGSLSSGGADFAESIAVQGESEPGDVMIIDVEARRSVTVSQGASSSLVAGIHSTQPGIIGGTEHHDAEQEGYIAMAVVGIVPCKVSGENGPIKAGDLLVTASKSGHAMRSDSPNPGTIVGKALAHFDGEAGKIPVLLSLQ